jgi:hypothetical protein
MLQTNLRRRARRVATLLASCAAVAVVAPAPSLADNGGEFYGVVPATQVFGFAPEQRDAHFEQMRQMGLKVLRIDASWAEVEPTSPAANGGQHVFNWATTDYRVGVMASHGMRWYALLAYSAPWAAVEPGNVMSRPANVADYAAYVRAVVGRYGRGGSFWREHPELPQLPAVSFEIWNEQNYDRFWNEQEDAPERYAELYQAARAAVHEVDPQADAVVGGLIDIDAEAFVKRMYAHLPALRGNVDALGFHPYQQEGGAMATIRRMRRALDAADGPGVPIEITEIGWFEGGLSEDQRAKRLQTLATKLPGSGLNVTRLIPYAWFDDVWSLMNVDGTPKPIGTAYAAAIRDVTSQPLMQLGTARFRGKRVTARAAAKRRAAARRRAAGARRRRG